MIRWYKYLSIVAMLLAVSGALLANESHDGYLYTPPFQTGKRFLIVQGFNGELSHQAALSRYAVDLAMPEGEVVCAARAGIVIRLNRNGDERVSQFVHIEHDDKTVGDYQHLQVGSIRVSIGQEVVQGECFAKVGTTGYSTGPHLHFAVLRQQGFPFFALVSLPFTFKGKNGAVIPERLLWLEHAAGRDLNTITD